MPVLPPVRYYRTNFAEKTRQWVTRTADFAIRFGR